MSSIADRAHDVVRTDRLEAVAEKALAAARFAQATKSASAGPYASAANIRVGNSSKARSRAGASMLRNFANNEVVRTAINWRKQQVVASPWRIVRVDDPKAKPDPNVVATVTRLLRYVNPAGDSWRTILEKVVEDVLVLDAGCIEIEHTLGGPAKATGCSIAALWAVDGSLVEIDPMWEVPVFRGGLGCDPTKPRYTLIDRDTRRPIAQFLNDDLAYIKATETTHSILGRSPVETLVSIIEAELYGEQYDFELLRNAVPPGYMDFGGGLTDEQVLAHRSYYESEIEGQARVAIFGGGDANRKPITTGKFGYTPAEMQRTEYMERLTTKIAFVFQIDKTIFGLTDTTNKASSQVLADRTDDGFAALATLVAETVTRKLVWQIDQNHGFEFTNLSTRDPLVQAKIDQIYLGYGVLLPNEVRARMDYKPYDGGDVPIRPAGAPPEPSDQQGEKKPDDGSGEQDDADKPDDDEGAKSARPFVRSAGGSPNADAEAKLEQQLHALTTRERTRLSEAWDRRSALIRHAVAKKLAGRKSWAADDFSAGFDGLADELVNENAVADAVNFGSAAAGAHRDDADPAITTWVNHIRKFAADVPDRLSGELVDAATDADTTDATVQDILDRIEAKLEAQRSSVTRYADPPWGSGWNGYGEQLRSSNILMVWELDGDNPCADCVGIAVGSPYENLPTWPGMGETKCLDKCKCRVVADKASWDEALGG
jgi:hypothetical protein